MNKKPPSRNKIIAVVLAILFIASVVLPIFYKSSWAADSALSSTAASSISSSSSILVTYYTGIPNDLTKDSPAFDLTVGLIAPGHTSANSFEYNTGIAAIESESFYSETNLLGTLTQVSSSSSDAPLKMVAKFNNVKWNGNKNIFSFRVGFTDIYANKIDQKVSFLVNQIAIDDEDQEAKKNPIPPPSPKIVVDEILYSDKIINTGEDFGITFKYYNSSDSIKIENLKIEAIGGDNFVIQSSSNTSYVHELTPKGIKSQSFSFLALKSIKESSSYPISLTFSYEYVIDRKREKSEDKHLISIPVTKAVDPPKLTISDISLKPTEIEPEEDSTITIQIANKGKPDSRADVRNVSVSVAGNFKSDFYNREVGIIKAGEFKTPTFTITTLPTSAKAPVQNTPPDTSSPVEATPPIDNKISGKITVTFEDDDGKQYTIDRDFGLNVKLPEEDTMEMGVPMDIPPEEPPAEQPAKKISTPIFIAIIASAVIILVVISLIVIKKIKAKRSELLDDEDI